MKTYKKLLIGAGLISIINIVITTGAIAEEIGVQNKITNWLKTEWIKTVEFQKESWSDSKKQLNQNKLYIQDLFTKVKDNVTQD